MGSPVELPYNNHVHEQVSLPTISFEEAYDNELKYQRKLESLLQPSTALTTHLTSPKPLKSDFVGIKRKAAAPSQQHAVHQKIHPQNLLPQLLQDQQVLPPSQNYRTEHLAAFPSMEKNDFLWCNLCEIRCMNALCLEQHRQGKNHLAKMEEVFNYKNTDSDKKQWCEQCNIWCIDKQSLAMHKVGKKHAARLVELEEKELKSNSVGTQQLDVQCSTLGKTTLWCGTCQIPCMNEFCYAQHLQGKKHKTKMEDLLNEKSEADKQDLWCKICKIWCIDKMSMAQHQIGKKHAREVKEKELKSNWEKSWRRSFRSVE